MSKWDQWLESQRKGGPMVGEVHHAWKEKRRGLHVIEAECMCGAKQTFTESGFILATAYGLRTCQRKRR